MLFASAIGLPALLIRGVHHVGHALLPKSIAGSTAAVDVARDSVEWPSLFSRTTRNQLPGAAGQSAALFTATPTHLDRCRPFHRRRPDVSERLSGYAGH